MYAQDAVAPRDQLQREGQGQLQDPERPLLLCIARDAVPKAQRTDQTGSIPRRITALSDSSGVVTFGRSVTGNCDGQGNRPYPGLAEQMPTVEQRLRGAHR